MSRVSKLSIPTTTVKSGLTPSAFIAKDRDILKEAYLVGEIEVRPKEQPRMSLGNYTLRHSPKRFVICVTPQSESDVIEVQIISLGTNGMYKPVLHIANYGNETVSAGVWQIK